MNADPEKYTAFQAWAQTSTTAQVVELLGCGQSGGMSLGALGLSCVEALLVCLSVPGVAFRLVCQGKVADLMSLPGFEDSESSMRQGWAQLHAKTLLPNSDVSLELSTSWLRARCQAQIAHQPMDPRLLPDHGDTLVWMLGILRQWKGRSGVRIDDGKEDLMKALGVGLAACHLSRGSAGNKVKGLTLGCAGYLEQRWPGCLRTVAVKKQHHTGRTTLLRRARGIEKSVSEKNVWYMDKWREPTGEEISVGIAAVGQSFLRGIAEDGKNHQVDRPLM